MQIKSKAISIVDIDLLIENPKNNNIHPDEQIERLAKLIKHTGFRNPLVVSNRSGFVLCGHGRIAAAKKAGLKELPVIYQDFDSEAEEYAYMTADNAIHNWSSIDLSKVNSEILDFGPDFDIEMLGLKDFKTDASEIDLPEMDSSDPDCQQVTFTVSNEQKDFLDEAMSKAKNELDCTDGINQNSNGNILGAIMRHYVQS